MKTKTKKPAAGNHTVSPFFSGGNSSGFIPVQAKLSVGKQGDQYEIEADRVAEQIVSQNNRKSESFFSPANQSVAQLFPEPAIQKKSEEEEEPVQMQPEEEDETLMPKAIDRVHGASLETENLISNNKGSGEHLNPNIQAQMEHGFGVNFESVKIHTDPGAVEASRQIGAQAFTTGNDIFFNSGKYNPETGSGKKLLAHELTHTIQQGAVAKPSNVSAIQRTPGDLSPEEIRNEEKRQFRSRNYGPITYTRNEISGSGFEASYLPASNRLNVTVRGKIRFADTLINTGGSYSSPNHFMNQGGFIPIMNALPPNVQSQILPYFQWTDDQKQIHLIRFRENLEAARTLWQDTGRSFQVDETGWEDVTAAPNININITEGQATHQTFDFGFISITNEASSDHVQVEIVKQPNASDVANITRIITAHNASTGATVNSGMIQGVRSYLGNDPGSRGTAPEGFNNFMSLESDRSDNPDSKFYFSSVMFANNESQLSDTARTELDGFFSDPMILMDNANREVSIDLDGYASAAGTSAYNRTLVESRIASVENYIDAHILNSRISTSVYTSNQSNDSDTSAEAELASSPATYDPADYRRVDIMVTREGRGGQNVFAHELGHVFGLGDEYAEVGSGYNRPAGTAATHDQLARDAGISGGALVADDNRMMSGGNEVGAAHYSTFANALNQLTSKRWKIVN